MVNEKRCASCSSLKPRESFPEDRRLASGLSSWCRACKNAATADWKRRNKEQVNAAARDWRKANPDKRRAIAKRWQLANAEKYKKLIADWQKRNAEKRRETVRNYAKRHSARVNVRNRRYSGQRKVAMPPWANEFFMEEAYALARLRTQVTGDKWVVDHIVPLRSAIVCGLHAHTNLQVIPHIANSSKGNKWWPDMPEAS